MTRRVNAPRAVVYRALTEAGAVATWMVPTGMTSHVHAFDAREGGGFRISLTYDEPAGRGKTTARTDTYHGHFVELVPGEKVVEALEFETSDPSMRGVMTITFRLVDADGGTEVLAVHDHLPPGLPETDNEAGWRMALDKLAELCEAHDGSASIGVGRPASHNSRNSTGANSMSAKQALPPRGLPAYRILTGPDDAAFCRRVSEALALGYRLYGSPAATFDGQHVIVAQALVWPSLLKQVSTARGVTGPRSARRSRPR